MDRIGCRDFYYRNSQGEKIEQARREARIELERTVKGGVVTLRHFYSIEANYLIELWCLTLARNFYWKEDKEVCAKLGYPENRKRYISALEALVRLGKEEQWMNKFGKKEVHKHLAKWPKAEEVGAALRDQREAELLIYQSSGFQQVCVAFSALGETVNNCPAVMPKQFFLAMQMAINCYLLLLCKAAPLRFRLSQEERIGLGEEIMAFSQLVKPQQWSTHATRIVELALDSTPFILSSSGEIQSPAKAREQKNSAPSVRTMDPERLLFYMKFFGYQRPNPLNGVLGEDYWQIWFKARESDKAVLVLDAPIKGNAIYILVGTMEQLVEASTTMTKRQLQESGLMPTAPIVHRPEGRGDLTWQDQVARVLAALVVEFNPL